MATVDSGSWLPPSQLSAVARISVSSNHYRSFFNFTVNCVTPFPVLCHESSQQMTKTFMSRIFSFLAMGSFILGLPLTLTAQDKRPLSKEESAEVIIKKLPTSDKDHDGRVRRLFIARKRITDLTALRKCPHLWYLEAAYNNLTSLKGLENCKQLTFLNLNHNQLTTLEGVEKLLRLETLGLYGNNLTDISHLHKLQNLKSVVLTGNSNLHASQIAALSEGLPDCDILFESEPDQKHSPNSSVAPKSKKDASKKQAVGAQEKPEGATDETTKSLIVQKLSPFATEVRHPKDWSFSQKHEGGNFTWVISEAKPKKAGQPFETGVEIKAFYEVSKRAKKSPEQFAGEYLENMSNGKDSKLLHQLKQQAGPLTAFTRTIELPKTVLATDVYWGDGKQLDVVVIVTRKAPEKRWNAIQPLFRKMTGFSLRTIVEGTRDTAGTKD